MEPNPTDLEGAAEAQEELAKQQAKRREVEMADFRRLMSEPFGRRFVWRLMSEANVFRDVESDNPLHLAKFNGERRQGLRLLNEILTLCPEQWVNMIKDQAR